MLPVVLSIRTFYGEVQKINGISVIDLLDSPLRREVRTSLHFSESQDPFYLPQKFRKRLNLPAGLGLEVDYLA